MSAPSLRFKAESGKDYPSWSTKKLNALAKIYDGTHMTPEYKNSGVPFFSVEHLTSNNFKDTKFISEEVFEKENKKVKLEKGDILMTKIGDIGTAKYIDWDVRASFYVSLALIKQSSAVNSLFLARSIASPYFQKELHQRIIHVAFPKKINLGEIGECLVQLPCEQEQTKIACFLTAVDEKIARLTQKCELLTQYKKGVMQQIFSQQLRFKDDEGREFPKWGEAPLSRVSQFLDGKRKPIKEGDRAKIQGKYPYYGASGINDYVNDYIFDEEIILLGEDGENIVSRNLPLAFKVTGKCWVNNHAHVIKPNEFTNIDFLAQYLENISYLEYNTGTAQPKLNQEICKKIPVPTPSFEEQTKIANYLTAIDDKINSAQAHIAAVKYYKQGLLQQMFV